MADLIGTEVAKNYQRVAPSSMFSTRELSFIKIVADNGGDSNIDFTKQKFEITGATAGSYAGTYLDADSYMSRAIRAIQGYVELFFIGEPDNVSFIVAVSIDTANQGVVDYSNMESDIKEALGIGNKAPTAFTGTAYNGDIGVSELTAVGPVIS